MTTPLVGFDSAWTANNSGALVAVCRRDNGEFDELGSLIIATYEDAERIIYDWQVKLKPTVTVQLLDQPTIVNNASGQRPVEETVGSLVSRRYSGMQPASKSRMEMFGDDAPVWRFLDHFGGPLNPLVDAGGQG
jgi:predicted RNase H-like nuclease